MDAYSCGLQQKRQGVYSGPRGFCGCLWSWFIPRDIFVEEIQSDPGVEVMACREVLFMSFVRISAEGGVAESSKHPLTSDSAFAPARRDIPHSKHRMMIRSFSASSDYPLTSNHQTSLDYSDEAPRSGRFHQRLGEASIIPY